MSVSDSKMTIQQSQSINQWISKIVNVESKSTGNLIYLNNILGPIKQDDIEAFQNESENKTGIKVSSYADQVIDNFNNLILNTGYFTHQIIFKIEEKVFIEGINIYEKVVPDSSIIKIEALNERNLKLNDSPSKSEKSNNNEWFVMWESKEPVIQINRPFKFSPKINRPLFKADTVRFTISGSLHLIHAIEINGNKLAVDDEEHQGVETKKVNTEEGHNVTDELSEYSSYARQMHKLIMSEMFADVYFEVEGKIIPAHRNVLVYRSEYFRAMIGANSKFKESEDSNHNQNHPIYIKDMSYDVFKEVLNYLYTGQVNDKFVPYYVLIGVIRAADLMNLVDLQKFCIFRLSLLLNKENVIKIYKEASETPELLTDLINLCFDMITYHFTTISKTQDFCSLPQNLMIQIIQHAVPQLNRVTSLQINSQTDSSDALTTNLIENEPELTSD